MCLPQMRNFFDLNFNNFIVKRNRNKETKKDNEKNGSNFLYKVIFFINLIGALNSNFI